MLKRWWVIIAVLGAQLLGCAHFHRHVSPQITQPPKQMSSSLAHFSRVEITGPMNVRIHTNVGRPWVHIHGDPRDTALVTMGVKQDTLRIVVKKKKFTYGPVDIEMSTPHLASFSYHGRGYVSGERLWSQRLDLTIVNQGQTMLEGQLNLHHVLLGGKGAIELKGGKSQAMDLILQDRVRVQVLGWTHLRTLQMSGHAWLSLYWLKSQNLSLRLTDHARAQIAGTAVREQIELRGQALFNGRYLRATEAFVKTYDRSEADIAVKRSQHTLASDNSNIYFYAIPTYRTDFMAFNGSVLDFEAWEAWT